MIKVKSVHDTIVVVKKDTIIQLVKMASDPTNTKTNAVIEHFDSYGSFYTAMGTLFTLIAIGVSLYTINQSAKLSRKQVLDGKLEEICDLINSLHIEYPNFYDLYILLEKVQHKANDLIKLRTTLNMECDKVDFDFYIEKLSRLNVLVNTYLGDNSKSKKGIISEQKELKYKAIGFIELYNALILVLKYKDLKMKEDNFNEVLPVSESIDILVKELNNSFIALMGYGGDSDGYILYRNTTFKKNVGMI
ncbi:hypothetical protein DM790_22900 [Flavobacterium collinsii]|nr:hypothetical protein [Flavobacterium collinsii]